MSGYLASAFRFEAKTLQNKKHKRYQPYRDIRSQNWYFSQCGRFLLQADFSITLARRNVAWYSVQRAPSYLNCCRWYPYSGDDVLQPVLFMEIP